MKVAEGETARAKAEGAAESAKALADTASRAAGDAYSFHPVLGLERGSMRLG